MNVAEVTPLVEAALEQIKADPVACRGDKPGKWAYKLGDTLVWINVYAFEKAPEKFYIRVMSPLCDPPDKKKEEFLEDLLEINYRLVGAVMVKREGWFYLLSQRETANITQAEIVTMMERVNFHSTDYYAKLAFKYEGCWNTKEKTPEEEKTG